MQRAGASAGLSGLTPGVRAYVVGVPALLAVAVALLLPGTSLQASDAALAAALVGGALLGVEALHRTGARDDRLVKDLLAAWWLPMAVLLPPVVVLLAPLPVVAFEQWRVRRSPVHRRVFSAASLGLSYGAVSVLLDGHLPGQVDLRWVLLVAAGGVVGSALNTVLVTAAAHAAEPQGTWRELLLDPDNLWLDGAEACTAVVLAAAVAVEPVLLALALPPLLLLQRGLLHGQLAAAALRDGKTGLLNAVTWEREAAAKITALAGRDLPVAVLLVDIDHFKAVNDTYGHVAGDAVLREVARAMVRAVRVGDLLGRFGGEEFVALLPAAEDAEASRVAERLRHEVSALVVPLDAGREVSVTVSVGVAVAAARAASVPDLLGAADRGLYRAKEAGRDRVGREG